MTIFNGGAGNDNLRGTNGADWIFGNAGDDVINGMGGNDLLSGGLGRDTLDGGTGNDILDGGLGNDLLIYKFGENRNSYDIYSGGLGTDALRLVFTAAEWEAAAVRQDIHRFLAYLPEYNEPLGWITNPAFTFRSMGLSVVGINKLEVVVDGRVIDATDRAVTARADTLALTEDDAGGVTVNLLANDLAPDGFRSVRIVQPANGTVELVSTDFAAAAPSAVIRFKPDGDYDRLKEGETATEVFTYIVTDKDGDERTASVTVTITGKNDRPVVTSAIAAMNADTVLSGSVAGNARDADGDALYFGTDRNTTPLGFDMDSDGNWTFDPQYSNLFGDSERFAVNALKAGETLTYEIKYYVFDPSYSYSEDATLTITVTGVNDAATVFSDGTTIYEDSYDWTVANGVRTLNDSFAVFDWDNEEGQATVILLDDVPADYLGTLVLTGYDPETGRYGYRFDIDSAVLAALGEGEERTQTYRLQIDDGQGSVTIETYSLYLEGDGNDPIDVPDYPLFGDDPVDADGFRTATFEIQFDDRDDNDVFSATVAWADANAIGDISVVVKYDEDDETYLEVTYRVPLSQIDAVAGSINQAFRVILTDNAGSTVEIDRSVEISYAGWQIGDAANDLIEGSDGVKTKDVLIGGEGSDRLVGGGGRDLLFGDVGPALPDDEFNGYEWWPQEWTPVQGFNDELDGGTGADRMTGGAGADRFFFRRGDADGDVITDFSGADGDRLIFFDWGDGATVTRLDATRWQVTSGDGLTREVFTLANGVGLTQADIVFQAREVEWRVGGEGDDDLSTPSDEVRHVLVGGGGRDALVGGAFADTLYGDEGPALPADEQNLFEGGERFVDGEYDDELDGAGGADTLVGGAGADRFILRPGEVGGDVILDFDGAQGDRLDFTDFGLAATLTRIDATRWEIADEDRENVETFTLANGADLTADDVLLLQRDTIWWIGGDGDDSLSTPGGDVAYVLVGGAGRDNLVGDNEADELYGDEGPALPSTEENQFDGRGNEPEGEYDDVLNGYGGADLLVGGAGGDLFIFREDQANGDVVRDFNGAEGDRLDFTDFGRGASFTQLDATRWTITDADGSVLEVITFTNAPVILPEYLIMM